MNTATEPIARRPSMGAGPSLRPYGATLRSSPHRRQSLSCQKTHERSLLPTTLLRLLQAHSSIGKDSSRPFSSAPFTNPSASESNALAGRSTRRISKWTYTRSRLLQWCKDSVVALVAEEIYRFPLRISAILRRPSRYTRRALLLPPFPEGVARLTLAQESAYLRACSEDIERLSRENRWAGVLALQIAVQAHLAGAMWSAHTRSSGFDGRQEP